MTPQLETGAPADWMYEGRADADTNRNGPFEPLAHLMICNNDYLMARMVVPCGVALHFLVVAILIIVTRTRNRASLSGVPRSPVALAIAARWAAAEWWWWWWWWWWWQ